MFETFVVNMKVKNLGKKWNEWFKLKNKNIVLWFIFVFYRVLPLQKVTVTHNTLRQRQLSNQSKAIELAMAGLSSFEIPAHKPLGDMLSFNKPRECRPLLTFINQKYKHRSVRYG